MSCIALRVSGSSSLPEVQDVCSDKGQNDSLVVFRSIVEQLCDVEAEVVIGWGFFLKRLNILVEMTLFCAPKKGTSRLIVPRIRCLRGRLLSGVWFG